MSGEDTEVLGKFLDMIETMLESNRDLELAHAYLGVFLKAHGSDLIRDSELREKIPRLEGKLAQAWDRLETKFFYNIAVIQALKNT